MALVRGLGNCEKKWRIKQRLINYVSSAAFQNTNEMLGVNFPEAVSHFDGSLYIS